MIHRACDKEFPLRARDSTADPVAVRTNDLDTVTEGKAISHASDNPATSVRCCNFPDADCLVSA